MSLAFLGLGLALLCLISDAREGMLVPACLYNCGFPKKIGAVRRFVELGARVTDLPPSLSSKRS